MLRLQWGKKSVSSVFPSLHSTILEIFWFINQIWRGTLCSQATRSERELACKRVSFDIHMKLSNNAISRKTIDFSMRSMGKNFLSIESISVVDGHGAARPDPTRTSRKALRRVISRQFERYNCISVFSTLVYYIDRRTVQIILLYFLIALYFSGSTYQKLYIDICVMCNTKAKYCSQRFLLIITNNLIDYMEPFGKY